MTSLMILFLVGCAAMAILLACLRGFSQARQHKRVEGVFVKVEKSKGRPGRQNRSLADIPQRKPDLSGKPAMHQVCSGTAALVEMAIILGSRTVCSDAPAGSADFKVVHNAGAWRKHKGNDPQTRVQPLTNS